MAIGQASAVTGMNLAADPIAQLRRRQAAFPAMLTAERERKHRKQDIREREKDRLEQKRQYQENLKFQRESQAQDMSASVMKLGMQGMFSDVGGDIFKTGLSTFGKQTKLTPGQVTGLTGEKGAKAQAMSGMMSGTTAAKSSIFSGLSGMGALKGGLTGGLAGFGLGGLLGGKKGRLLGGLAGGLLGAGFSSGLFGNIASGLFGGGGTA